MNNYQTLRDANVVRQAEWDPAGHAKDLLWRMNELAGEIGEICNVLKKLHRERCGVEGFRATKDQLAEELADGVICIDLLAIDAQLDPVELESLAGRLVDLDTDSLTLRGCLLTVVAGKLADTVLDTMSSGSLFDHMAPLAMGCSLLLSQINDLAKVEKIDLHLAVANKFNATTHKVGLTTFLRYEGD